jgi:hypothetical protein
MCRGNIFDRDTSRTPWPARVERLRIPIISGGNSRPRPFASRDGDDLGLRPLEMADKLNYRHAAGGIRRPAAFGPRCRAAGDAFWREASRVCGAWKIMQVKASLLVADGALECEF